jgi:glutamine amidotransferase
MYAAVFKDTQPAWNNINLRELCMAIQSNCMIAHVRAASVFAGISQQNCHPFTAGTRLLFCHNGRIGNFDMVRRPFHQLLSDEAYVKGIKGTT